MARKRSNEKPNDPERRVVLYAQIPENQHTLLQVMALIRKCAVVELVKEALDAYLSKHCPSAKKVELVIEQICNANKKQK